VAYPARKTLIEALLQKSSTDTEIEEELQALVGNLPIRSLVHGGILELMPYRIEVK
jgi:hypothetical protein